MFEFREKTIVIISPQKWGKMHISKHHYAIELAKRNNTVYFLNPPIRQFLPKNQIEKKNDNLFIVNYSYFFPYNLRFHARKLFDKLQAIQIKNLLKKIESIDIVWCFETNGFSDLSIFNSKFSIYHPVDNINGNNQKSLLETSDFVFSVSDVIIQDLQKINPEKKINFINHGLSDYCLNKITKPKKNRDDNNKKKTVYFIGNLLLTSLDRPVTKKIILENKDVNFVFIGSYKPSNVSGLTNSEDEKFIHFLRNQKNVLLKGIMHPKNAINEIHKADILLVLIDPQKDINKGSNSHKILEYLSTGKVIVANHISTYVKKRYLIEMVDEMHNENLPALFQNVINNLEHYNSPELQKKRIEFALDNTYEKQIQRIEKIISK